jgi:N-acetylmuramoyl-L-alanine amidase
MPVLQKPSSGKPFLYPLPLGFLLLFLVGCAPKPTFRILDKPINFNEERKQLSIDYLRERHGLDQTLPSINPKMIVLHWTVIPTIESTFDVFDPVHLPGARAGIASASSLNVSSQFLIDRDGEIFRLLPDTAFARHVIGLNYCSIGIENIGSEKSLLTKAQLKSNENLIRYLTKKYPEITYLIGHYEYQKFEKSELWKETDSNYRTVKTDPGTQFMRKIRRRLHDLPLMANP